MAKLLATILTGFLFITVEGTVPSNQVVHYIVGYREGSWVIVRTGTTDTLWTGEFHNVVNEVPLPTNVPLKGRRIGP